MHHSVFHRMDRERRRGADRERRDEARSGRDKKRARTIRGGCNRFVFGSSFDLFPADESGVAFSLSPSTEGEITFVGGSLSVSASEVTSRYKERGRERILSR